MSKTFIIREISREPSHGPHDRLVFERGVNVIVGQPNTGKTRWLEMLDYMFAYHKKAEDKLGEDIFEKYESISAIIELAGESLVISRRWHEPGVKGKVFVGDESMSVEAFQSFLLGQLEIPEVSFPQGDPYGSRTWPTLRFRSLLRHMYRRQKLWSDFADRQPESEQHACLMQFVGLAESLFSDKYAEMVSKQKKIYQLESQRDNFMSILAEISSDLVGDSVSNLSVTPGGLSAAIDGLYQETERLNLQRDSLMQQAINQSKDASESSEIGIEKLSNKLVTLRAQSEDVSSLAIKNSRRRSELVNFQDAAIGELARLNRAKSSSEILSPIRVTHCPVCDHEIQPHSDQEKDCYLCGQQHSEFSNGNEGRLDFEIEQLESEIREAKDLLASLADDDEALSKKRDLIEVNIKGIQRQLLPTRNAVMAVLPPQILLLEGEIGGAQEKISQLERISNSLAKREDLADKIQHIRREVVELESDVARLAAGLDFEGASDRIADAMNDYVKSLLINGERAWTQATISVALKERSFSVRVGQTKWQVQLGGTLSLYFLFAYHYALISLVKNNDCNYPGVCVLDFPAEVEGTSVADKENFILNPFVSLMAKDGFEHTQLIAAGSAFEGLEGAHRIELTKVWKT